MYCIALVCQYVALGAGAGDELVGIVEDEEALTLWDTTVNTPLELRRDQRKRFSVSG